MVAQRQSRTRSYRCDGRRSAAAPKQGATGDERRFRSATAEDRGAVARVARRPTPHVPPSEAAAEAPEPRPITRDDLSFRTCHCDVAESLVDPRLGTGYLSAP